MTEPITVSLDFVYDPDTGEVRLITNNPDGSGQVVTIKRDYGSYLISKTHWSVDAHSNREEVSVGETWCLNDINNGIFEIIEIIAKEVIEDRAGENVI